MSMSLGAYAMSPPASTYCRYGYIVGSRFMAANCTIGNVEGENIAIEYRWAEGHDDRLANLAAELVRLKPDVIMTTSSPGTFAAKRATDTIPIIFYGELHSGRTRAGRRPFSAGREHYGIYSTGSGLGGQTSGAFEGDCFRTLPRRHALERDACREYSRLGCLLRASACRRHNVGPHGASRGGDSPS